MREIKFRAWDKEQKHWVNCLHFSLHLNGNVTDPVQNDLLMVDRYDIQQFTGLYDKNSKEIYEGDILRVGEGIMFPARLTVEWLGFGFKLTAPAYVNSIENSNPENLTVIGNMYESPHLLGSNSGL